MIGLVLYMDLCKGQAPNQDDFKSTTFDRNAVIKQTIGAGSTAIGRVVSYDAENWCSEILAR